MQKQKNFVSKISTFELFEPDDFFNLHLFFGQGLDHSPSCFRSIFKGQHSDNNNLSDFFNSLPEKDKFKEHIPLNPGEKIM
ncbi:MAG: hypothetical protein CM1200mP16_15390 [Nitrospina sp.]|nr:MAG: hypothetical protein CM1200mP16_15390 [Nitrospina sp.]